MLDHPLHIIRLRNWRNIEAAELELHPIQTVLLGANGQGKSNLLEAVYVLATATSFRSRKDEELIQWNQPAAHLRGKVATPDGLIQIEFGLDRERGQKVVKVDSNPLPRLSDLYGRLRITLLAPEDLSIVSGSPDDRRRYIDMAIAQVNQTHIRILQQYRRALRHRNHVLRGLTGSSTRLQQAHLDAWDSQVAQLGAEIMKERAAMVERLLPKATEYHAGLAGKDERLEISYRSNVSAEPGQEENAILTALTARRNRDIELGRTTSGPHRDDLLLRLNDRELATTASQGQRRTSALALRLAEAFVITGLSGEMSLLLIDDVVYEMDSGRRARFWEAIPSTAQRIVTATSTDYLGQHSLEGCIYHVQFGQIRPDRS